MAEVNQNLLFTIIAAATTAFLGLLVYLHNRNSISSRIFIAHSLIGVLWAIVNYVSLIVTVDAALFWIRSVIFIAVPYVLLFFVFVLNFPEEKLGAKAKSWIKIVVPFGVILCILAFSPLVFNAVEISNNNVVPVAGKFAPIFGIGLIIFLITSTIIIITNYIKSHVGDPTKYQWLSIGFGLLFSYALLIFFVLLRVILYSDTTYVIYSPLFILPIFIGAAFAILRLKLFNVKVFATEIFIFLLLLASFTGIFIANNTLSRIIASLVTIAVLFIGILLVKSVLNEIKQRELVEKLNKELERQKAEIEELSRFKTQLLSFASHDLKAPFAQVKGFISILKDGIYGKIENPKVLETLDKMNNSATDGVNLIETLLNLRRIDEGKIEYRFGRVDLVKLVRDVVTGLESIAKQKNLKLEAHLPDDEVIINADAERIKEVTRNLVENAIKYTPQGSVTVSLDRYNDEATVSIKDTGLGMSPELIPHLFQEFIREERIKKQVRGTGLGLYIAKKMLEAHGGTIWAESEGEGKGSTFHMKLKKL